MASEEPTFEQPETLTICPDGHRCENGAVCEEKENDENNYRCDCEDTGLDHAFAGLYCEHKATTYCVDEIAEMEGIPSKTTFCTNGGECAKIIDGNDPHKHFGCICQPNYVGSHCQFVAGTISEEDLLKELAQSKGFQETHQNPKKKVLPALVGVCVAALIILAALMLVKKFILDKRPSTKEVHTVTEDLALDTDGSSSFSPREGSLPTVEEVKSNLENLAAPPRVATDGDEEEPEVI